VVIQTKNNINNKNLVILYRYRLKQDKTDAQTINHMLAFILCSKKNNLFPTNLFSNAGALGLKKQWQFKFSVLVT